MNDMINTGSKLHLHSDDSHYCEPYILLHVLTLQEIKTCLSIMCISNLSRWQEPTTHPVHLVSYISYPLIIKEAKWPPIFCTSKGALFSLLCLLQALTHGFSHEENCLFYSVLCSLKLLLLVLLPSVK